MEQSEIRKQKRELRSVVKTRLKQLTSAEKERKSRIICKTLIYGPHWREADTVCAFLSMKDEVDTSLIIESARTQKKTIAIPLVQGEEITFHSFNDPSLGLKKNYYRILEPELPDGALDFLSVSGKIVVVVPALAFDREKKRLGKGKGFYDRFMTRWEKTGRMTFIGIAFNEQITTNIPVDQHDKPVDMVITDKHII